MINIGEWNELQLKREKEFGVYLGEEDGSAEVLLPRKQVPKGAKVGDIIYVFVYRE